MDLKFYKMHPEVPTPKKATAQSACFDIHFCSAGKEYATGYTVMNRPINRPFRDGNLFISPGERVAVPTGLILDIPEGYSVRVHARSGLSLKNGLSLANAEGVIDSDYVDELFVLLWNNSGNGAQLSNGDRIAQAELVKLESYELKEITKVPKSKSNRAGGLGSTGVKEIPNVQT